MECSGKRVRSSSGKNAFEFLRGNVPLKMLYHAEIVWHTGSVIQDTLYEGFSAMVFLWSWPGQFITDTSDWSGSAHKFHYPDHLAERIDPMENLSQGSRI